MKDTCKHIRHSEQVFCNGIPDVVGSVMRESGLESTSSEQYATGAFVEVSAVFVLYHGQATEFPGPHDNRA